MSFILHDPLNKKYQPGWFLASGECRRETCQVPANHSQVVTADNGSKYVPAGALITGKGLLYEDVDVTTGAMPGSVVTEGTVYADRLPTGTSTTGLTGITVIATAPAITRPSFES